MQDGVPEEVVIVRRRGSLDDDNHGHGVWKIAYADFMTAMMAFFLVMWLINVTDDSVRRGVAQYFNPVRLASTAPHQKGLNDPNVPGDTHEDGANAPEGDKGASHGGAADPAENPGGQSAAPGTGSGHEGTFSASYTESDLLADPYAVLESLAATIPQDEGQGDMPTAVGAGQARQAGARGGDAYRDPFDPMYWQFLPNRMLGFEERGEAAEAAAGAAEKGPEEVAAYVERPISPPVPLAKGEERPEEAVSAKGMTGAPGTTKPALPALMPNEDALVAEVTKLQADEAAAAADGVVPQDGKPLELAVAEPDTSNATTETADRTGVAPLTSAEQIKLEIAQLLNDEEKTPLAETAQHIAVKAVDEGVLISLTDDQNFGMFAIGSSEPRPELVKLLEKIAGVLADKPGEIVIKGHTDARPFKRKTSDNWQLSSSRARMALYMLTRGGVKTDRFERVEGYADRDLKLASDPLAAANRRVEILIRKDS